MREQKKANMETLGHGIQTKWILLSTYTKQLISPVSEHGNVPIGMVGVIMPNIGLQMVQVRIIFTMNLKILNHSKFLVQ